MSPPQYFWLANGHNNPTWPLLMTWIVYEAFSRGHITYALGPPGSRQCELGIGTLPIGRGSYLVPFGLGLVSASGFVIYYPKRHNYIRVIGYEEYEGIGAVAGFHLEIHYMLRLFGGFSRERARKC